MITAGTDVSLSSVLCLDKQTDIFGEQNLKAIQLSKVPKDGVAVCDAQNDTR